MSGSPRLVLTRAFAHDQAVLNAYNRRRLGLREVPVAAITGSVGRTDLLLPARLATWRRTDRYQRIMHALAVGERVPPVELYLLDGHYYILDGHHRVAASRQLGTLDVDADVTEFLPARDAPAAAWHRAHAAFERDTGLTGLHIRRDGYEQLRRQIAEHNRHRPEQSQAPRSFAEAAAHWEEEVYRPALADLAVNGVLDRFPELTAAELYLAVCDHQRWCSERLRRDIGFAAAAADFARAHRYQWLHSGWRAVTQRLSGRSRGVRSSRRGSGAHRSRRG